MKATTKTVSDSAFLIGDPSVERPVVEDDYPCEYSVMSYLAAATAGRPVGVGALYIRVELTAEERLERQLESPTPDLPYPFTHGVVETDLVYIPEVGLWLLEPLFRKTREPRQRLEDAASLFAKLLGVAREELPVNFALVQSVPDMAFDACRVDPSEIYDVNAFHDIVGTLTERARPLPDGFDLDELVVRLLSFGDLVDAKNGSYDDWELPRWLHEMLFPPTDARVAS